MADKPPPDQNILVYVPDYQNATLQTSLRKPYYRSYESPRCDSVRSEAAESTCSSLSSTETLAEPDPSELRPPESVAPPFGWKRLTTNGVIIYVSPSNTALSSTEQVRAYLQTEGTCKCGLECPLNCDATFNFNPKVLTRPWTAPVVGPEDLTKLCNHKRKLLTQSSFDTLDNRYDGSRRRKRKVGLHPSVSQLLTNREQVVKDQQYAGPPWRDGQQFSRGFNGYQDESQPRYDCVPGHPRLHEGPRFPSHQQLENFKRDEGEFSRLPWQQTRAQFGDRPSNWNELRKKRVGRKRFEDEGQSLPEQPSFMDDPSGYLAQQTALLNSTISRQSVDCGLAPKTYQPKRSRPDSSKMEEPTSTLPDRREDESLPIQGTTVSTSNRSLVEIEPVTTVVTTMASGHTVSSNTITSVLAGRANTATVSVNNPPAKQPSPDLVKSVLVSNGQLLVAGQSKTTSPANQISVTSQMINQPAVLVNTLPAPLLLQPSVVVDGLNAVQIPQIVGLPNQGMEENLLSPDSKRKSGYRKRRVSPVGSMVLPQGGNNVVVQPQQIQQPMLQALTILPSKGNFPGTQQLITANMLQPLNLVQNFPIQQFLVPAGVSGMVMPDGTILQDAVQLNLLTPVQNAGVFNGQNLLSPGMVIREPNPQTSKQYLNSPNQYLVNNAFSGQLSPMLNVSPTQRTPEYSVVQPNTSNTTMVQQNTTIVQQTTMVSNQQTQPTPTLNLNQNFILAEKPNFILSPNNEKILVPDSRGNFMLGIDKPNFLVNNYDKSPTGFLMDKKNSVSTQTQNQVLQISSSPALVVAKSGAMCSTTFSGSPPDTTTLSPVDQEVTTSLQPISPSDQSLPMVHCVSSSSQQEEGFQLDNYNGKFTEPNCTTPTVQNNDDEDYKMTLRSVPDSVHILKDEMEITDES